MSEDIIKSWRCWYTDTEENIAELNSLNNQINDIPALGIQAIKLWFYTENTCRFISGNKYYYISNNDIINQPSSSVSQTDDKEDITDNNFLVFESSVVSEETYNKIFDLMIESLDPTL
jgi:hypothetical protein